MLNDLFTFVQLLLQSCYGVNIRLSLSLQAYYCYVTSSHNNIMTREFDSFKCQKMPQSLSGLYFFAKILLNKIAYYYVL